MSEVGKYVVQVGPGAWLRVLLGRPVQLVRHRDLATEFTNYEAARDVCGSYTRSENEPGLVVSARFGNRQRELAL